MRAWALTLVLLLSGSSRPVDAAPPAGPSEIAAARLTGRVRVAGSRTPLADAKVMVVDAPDDVRPGDRARTPLDDDPGALAWIRETQTDEDGRFAIPELPHGKVRVVVVAPGHERLEVWAEASADAEDLALFLVPRAGTGFRTEVISERDPALPRHEHEVVAERARVYPGTAGDPVRAVQNLPGVARAPGGLGLVAVRGGDPRQTGIYVDGHPVPRGFHVLPIAAIVSQSMVESVELTPGNYDAAYGGHAGGVLEINTKPGPLLGAPDRGVHGEAHLDLFDVGGGFRGPLGPGAVAFAFRRSHVGDVVKAADGILGNTGILVPDYWDYMARIDMPIRRRHWLTLEALGAGDGLQDTTEFEPGNEVEIDFRTAFHRFDLGYRFEHPRVRAGLSAALLLDDTYEGGGYTTDRNAWTASLRGNASHRIARRATVLTGFDLVDVHATRTSNGSSESAFDIRRFRFGTWVGVAFQFAPRPGPVVIRPQVRLNVFGTGNQFSTENRAPTEKRVAVDPRLDIRAYVHPRVEILAAVGRYSSPATINTGGFGGLGSSTTSTAIIDVPGWLVAYFDPAQDEESFNGLLTVQHTYHALLGGEIALPWALKLRTTLFWRESPTVRRGWPEVWDWFGSIAVVDATFRVPAARAYGLEVLLDRTLGKSIHGLIGYTLLRAQTTGGGQQFVLVDDAAWGPTVFDQRHNLIALAVFELPRAFRFGARFRVVSGNPEEPVIGTIVSVDTNGYHYEPIRGKLGTTYAPTFHQLDIRVDKTWYANRFMVIGYLDVQNVYNNLYPEIWVYSRDWTERGARLGLPIFPSLGLRIEV